MAVDSAEPLNAELGVSRREQAVARSLCAARARAEGRFQRFLDAALALMRERELGREFTVQEVVDRSGQSLRLFYQYFGGKHELLLALFEDSVRVTTDVLRERIEAEGDPLERLHRFVVDYYRLCRPAPEGCPSAQVRDAWMMVDFAQQLLTSHPAEAAVAFAPLVSLFGEVFDGAAHAEAIRPGLSHGAVAGFALEAVMFNEFSAIIGGTPARAGGTDGAEELWDLVLHGLGTDLDRG